MHAFGGARFYFTPQLMASLYAGTEYWAQLTHREPGDTGVAIGIVGAQGVVSPRASLFAIVRAIGDPVQTIPARRVASRSS